MRKDQLRLRRATTIILTVISVVTSEACAAGMANIGNGSSSVPIPPPPPPPAMFAPPPPPPMSDLFSGSGSEVRSIGRGGLLDQINAGRYGKFSLKKVTVNDKPKASSRDVKGMDLADMIKAQSELVLSGKTKGKSRSEENIAVNDFLTLKARQEAIAKKTAENKERAARLRKEKEAEWAVKGKEIEAQALIEKARREAEVAKLIREKKGEKASSSDETIVVRGIDPALHQNIVSDLRGQIEELRRTVSSLSLNRDSVVVSNDDLDTRSLGGSSARQVMWQEELASEDSGIQVEGLEDDPVNISWGQGAGAVMPDSLETASVATVEDLQVKSKEEETEVESQTLEVSSSEALDATDDIEQASKVGQSAVTTIEPLTEDILSSRTASFEAAMQMINMPHHLIKNRLFGFGNSPALIAVAAGDEEYRVKYGVWGSGGFAISKQSAIGNIASYKGRQAAATIGVDAEIGEGVIIGLAYSNVKSILKFNETYGKSRINSHILSLYYQRDLGGNLGLQLMASLSGSEIKNKVNVERHGKSYAGSLGVEGDISYRHNCENGMQLISIMGLKYHYIRGGLYKEQDPRSGYMLKVLGKSERMLAGILGGKIVFQEMDLGSSLRLVPSVSASYEKNFTRSRRVVIGTVATSDKAYGEVRVEMPRAFKQGYNIGGGIALVSNILRLEVDYNYHLQKAYRSHEGILKLKVSL